MPLGVGGSAAISADGKHIAYNLSIPFDPGDAGSAALVATDFLGAGDAGGVIAQDVAGGGRPAWSPDGTKIAYAGRVGGTWDVFVADAGGGPAPVDLTNDVAANDRNPRWSPDGSKIAFESDRTGNWEIFTMAAGGSGQTNVTNDPAEDRLGDWSPDSTRIVFSSTRTGGGDLYAMPAAGGAATRLTSLPGAETHAAWSPDGSTIAFSNDADGSPDVYEIAANGSNLIRLTNNSYVDLVQDWQPVQDLHPPVAHALASKGLRHRTVRMRYRVSEDSGRAAVNVQWQYSRPGSGSFGFSGTIIQSVKPGHVYTFVLPARAFRGAPQRFRFCIQAYDPSLNQSASSCARFTFVKPKKKRKG